LQYKTSLLTNLASFTDSTRRAERKIVERFTGEEFFEHPKGVEINHAKEFLPRVHARFNS
jgi:hypothetical protein